MKEGNTQKVIQLGIQNKVYDALKNNVSVEKLTRQLNDKGIKITAQSIRKFIKTSKAAQRQVIQTDLREATEYKKMAMDYNAILTGSLEKLKVKIDQAEQIEDLKDSLDAWNKLYKSMLQTVELFSKIAGDMKAGTKTDIKIIYREISNDLERMNKDKIFNPTVIDVDDYVVISDKEKEDEVRE